jgi:hypothetical protein
MERGQLEGFTGGREKTEGPFPVLMAEAGTVHGEAQ